MADANTGMGGALGGTSDKPLAPQAGEPEARIIEETVIRRAPLNLVQSAAIPETPAPQPAAIVPSIPPPAEINVPLLQSVSPLSLQPEEGHVVSSTIAPVPLANEVPAAQASEPPHNPEIAEKEQTVITRILQEIKLPERREPVATSHPTTETAKTFDTTLVTEQVRAITPEEKKVPEVPAPEAATQAAAENGESAVFSIVAPLRTLKNDLQEIVRTQKMSLVRAVALEQGKKQGEGDALHPELHPKERGGRAFRVIFAVALLFILGGAALFGIYIITQDRMSSAPVQKDTSLLFSEAAVSVSLQNQSPSDLKRLLAQGRMGGGGTLGSITRIVPTVPAATAETIRNGSAPAVRPATTEEFLGALGTRASSDLLRALGSDFFFGFHTVDKNAPVLVIPVISYQRAFAGMLAWENTMSADLAPIFMPIPDQKIGSGGLPEKRNFEDLVMRNYDVRALKDDAGNIGLYYSFPTQNILVIAESPYSFTEVLSRLQAGRKL